MYHNHLWALILVQNGTGEEVKKIVTTLNEAEVPSEDVVGEFCFELLNISSDFRCISYCGSFFFLQRWL